MSEDELREGETQEKLATPPAEQEAGPGAADDSQGQPKPRGAMVRPVLLWTGGALAIVVVLIGVASFRVGLLDLPDWLPTRWCYADFQSVRLMPGAAAYCDGGRRPVRLCEAPG